MQVRGYTARCMCNHLERDRECVRENRIGIPMSAMVKLSAELRGWIEGNLERGCAPEQMIESMIAQRFDSAVARALIEAFVQARRSGVPLTGDTLTLDTSPDRYVYETPRLQAGHSLHTADCTVSVLIRLERPMLAVLADVLSSAECDHLISLARPRLAPSTVVDPETGENKVAAHRSSEGMFFRPEETPFIATLERRIARIMNCPMENGEGLQVLRYPPGAQSTPHFDFLIPSNLANQQSLARSGQRISTLVIYLNDVEAGGETVFPEVGLALTPRKGHALYFEYCNSRDQVDPLSLHAGAPITAGEKWAVTKWMRQRRFVSA